MEGRKRIAAVIGCLFMVTPAWANGSIIFKNPEPATPWELVSLPIVPAPLENTAPQPFWYYATEIDLVAYPAEPRHRFWVAIALERYQTRLFQSTDDPYFLPTALIPLY